MAKIKIQSLSSTTGKETIYVDVDDEITTVIDKVQAAKGKVVALVLPKRAPVLQSIVNMKLLKRTADSAGKNLVLITSESGLLPLAGAVGLYVASTPNSKPGVPSAPAGPDDEPEDADEPLDIVDGNAGPGGDDFDPAAAGDKTVGELAGAAKGKGAKAKADDGVDESIDMDDESGEDPAEADGAIIKLPKLKKDHKLRIPNFDSFRKRLALGIFVFILLVVGWVWAFKVAPKAHVVVKTDSSTIETNLNLTLSTDAKTLDASANVVPATAGSQSKTSTQQVAATGQQNNGAKASGQVTLTLKDCNNDTVVIPTGSGLSANGKTYVTQSSLTLQSITVGGHCNPTAFSNVYSGTVTVKALKGGSDYNTANGTNFTVPSSIDGASSVTAKASSDIGGGTDDVIKIVQQSDIDGATSKITSADSSSVKSQLASNLQSKGLQPIQVTFAIGTPQVNSSAKAGDAADSVTVTAVTTYTMLGVQKSDLRTLVVNNVNGQLDKGKQVILDDGVANAKFTTDNPATATAAAVAMDAKSVAGPHLDTGALKKQVAGMKRGDVKSFIKQTPGVTDVDVHFSPLWVSLVPKNTSKITIDITKAGS
ncbi:MAG TPA: baseplate J/gp47 family protein [Candidatus Saccharimonadales bacterium]|nr:baseplate J/gp47 family protein [Candidatus Saccharimonadales bacterium]